MSTIISTTLTQRFYTWTQWKAVYAIKGRAFQYEDDGVLYTIWTYEYNEVYICQIWKDSVPALSSYTQIQNDLDKSDFESNYKASGNMALSIVSTVKAQLQDNAGNALSSNNGQLQTRDIINTSSQYKSLSVSTSAVEAVGGSSRLSNRKVLSITPVNGTVWYGTSSAVTTSNGTPVFKNQTVAFAFSDNVPVYLISSGTVDVRILEGS